MRVFHWNMTRTPASPHKSTGEMVRWFRLRKHRSLHAAYKYDDLFIHNYAPGVLARMVDRRRDDFCAGANEPGEWTMAMTPTKPGEWYFFIVCHNCEREILLSEAPSPEQEKAPKIQGGKVTCPHCQSARTFQPSQVGRGRVPENK
jgi:hypothetical protein